MTYEPHKVRWMLPGESARPLRGGGSIYLTDSAAERALRGAAIGRGNWTFAGSDCGGESAVAMYTPVESAKLSKLEWY